MGDHSSRRSNLNQSVWPMSPRKHSPLDAGYANTTIGELNQHMYWGAESMGQWLKHLVRLVVSAIVLMFISFLIPGFATVTFWTALLAAAVITVLGWLIEVILGRAVSPYARGIVGFLVSAVVIYATKFIVPGMTVSIAGALLAAFVIGLVDMFVPTTLR